MFFIVLDLRLTKVEYSGTPFFMPFLIAPFVFDKKPPSSDEKPPSSDEKPTSLDEEPASLDEKPANLDENPANPGWNDQFAPDEMTSPSCALAQRQTYPISPPSCTKDRHGPPFYSFQEENAGARKRKDKYIGDRWREIPQR